MCACHFGSHWGSVLIRIAAPFPAAENGGRMFRRVAVFGATGSIGTQALDVARAHKEKGMEIVCVSADRNAQKLSDLIHEFRPRTAALTDEKYASKVDSFGAELFTGPNSLVQALEASQPDLAVIAVSGVAGLPLLAACLKRKMRVALANKEAIVSGANVISRLRRENPQCELWPLDSEHAALFQCLGDTFDTAGVNRLWLTASGGPFRTWNQEQIEKARPEDALKHPTWNMGKKITIDCASLANKGLEVIEAHYLFNMPPEKIKVVVQPQSLVHSMAEFADSTVLAQMGPPDMHLPIRRAMLEDDMYARDGVGAGPVDFWNIGSIAFEKPDIRRFPCLRMAYGAIDLKETAVYNAADEAAVAAFADGAVSFGSIPRLIEAALEHFGGEQPETIEEILDLHECVRRFTNACINDK